MKKLRLFAAGLVVAACSVAFVACDGSNKEEPSYLMALDPTQSYTLEVGQQDIDFTRYFIIRDVNGLAITVTPSMLDLSKVDTSKAGTFEVELTIGGGKIKAVFTVVEVDHADEEVKAVLKNYENRATWNFTVQSTVSYNGIVSYEEEFGFKGADEYYAYEYSGERYVDYLQYDKTSDQYYYYVDNANGTYQKLSSTDEMYEWYAPYVPYIELSSLSAFTFERSGDHYIATDSAAAGNSLAGEASGCTYTALELYVRDGVISRLALRSDELDQDGNVVKCQREYVLSGYGTVDFDLKALKLTNGDTSDDPIDSSGLAQIAAWYQDYTNWNFAVRYQEVSGGKIVYEDYYEYLGDNVLNRYEGYDENENYLGTFEDYLEWNEGEQTYYFYADNGDGTYSKYVEGSADFEECFAYMNVIDPATIADYAFTEQNGYYAAQNPSSAGNAVLGEYEDYTWSSLFVYVEDGKISKIEGTQNDGYTIRYVLEGYGTVKFTLPSVGSSQGEQPPVTSNTMEKQAYNAATFDNERLQDKMLTVDGAIGLPSVGAMDVLVVPVQFSGDTITSAQLDKLNLAFNGTSADTGWESVKTYYQKSSYGKLDLSFDIQSAYSARHNASYYENYSENYWQDGQMNTRTGEEVILKEVLSYYETRLDLTKYDSNGDGCIDAVYLIYSADVDYDNGEFYWAYVTWFYGEDKYDGLDAYYYLFAGFDFMDEDVSASTGMKINASTYIHETGHLLGLDDYYDYEERKGANEGLGGADMMDYTVGDHNAYSKIMLGWIDATVVTSTSTLTIGSLQASGECLLIPLSFNNSYFCEYLLVDLYAAQGLNKMHASMADSCLYDGAAYGVRIYHLSSSINDPYNNDYQSFTDNNNSSSAIALIKLIEGDGGKKFSTSNGLAVAADLWQKGDVFSKIQPSYTRNDGKKFNFDISIGSVSASSATITVTF